MATIYNSTSFTIDGNSQLVLESRPRRTFLTITNLSDADVAYLSLNDAASSGTGMGIHPGSVLTLEVNEAFNEALYGITAGNNVTLSIEERYDDTV